MKNIKIFEILFLSVIAMFFTGCASDKKMHDFENKVFISVKSFASQIRVHTDEEENEISSGFSVGMVDVEENDVEIVLAPALKEEYLEKYRMAYYDDSAELLDPAHFNLPEDRTVIKAGGVMSSKVTVDFKNLMELDYETSYVLPLTIVSASGLSVLESASTVFFVIKEASLINIVADVSDNCAWPEWGSFDKVADMETFTMEALIKPSAFTNKEIHTIMGIEDVFLVRVGDRLIPKNQLQVAVCRIDDVENTSYRAAITNASMKLNTDRWYHIAVTFSKGVTKVYIDGKLRGEGDFSNGDIKKTSVNFKVPHSDESEGKPRCFWIGHSYDDARPFLGCISEVRMWNKALTSEEINVPGHFYKINIKDDNATEGLVAYWKFDDGTGKTIKDYSGNGNDLTAASAVVWRDVELPVKE